LFPKKKEEVFSFTKIILKGMTKNVRFTLNVGDAKYDI
jgi:hypothetical protein